MAERHAWRLARRDARAACDDRVRTPPARGSPASDPVATPPFSLSLPDLPCTAAGADPLTSR
jgi:hypothetical protein